MCLLKIEIEEHTNTVLLKFVPLAFAQRGIEEQTYFESALEVRLNGALLAHVATIAFAVAPVLSLSRLWMGHIMRGSAVE